MPDETSKPSGAEKQDLCDFADRALSLLDEVEPSVALRKRVFEIPARAEAQTERAGSFADLFSLGLLVRAMGFASLMLGLGALSGWISVAPDQEVDETVAEVSEGDADWEELSELALADALTEDW